MRAGWAWASVWLLGLGPAARSRWSELARLCGGRLCGGRLCGKFRSACVGSASTGTGTAGIGERVLRCLAQRARARCVSETATRERVCLARERRALGSGSAARAVLRVLPSTRPGAWNDARLREALCSGCTAPTARPRRPITLQPVSVIPVGATPQGHSTGSPARVLGAVPSRAGARQAIACLTSRLAAHARARPEERTRALQALARCRLKRSRRWAR